MRIRPSRAASEQSGLIRKKAWIKLIAIAFRIILRKDSIRDLISNKQAGPLRSTHSSTS